MENDLTNALELRRRELRMSYAALAKRSGVSMPTVFRILSGQHKQASFDNIRMIAETLGMDIQARPTLPVHELLLRTAEEKARQLVGLVQGTSALESQAVGDDSINEMTRRTVHELLAGSPRKLWG